MRVVGGSRMGRAPAGRRMTVGHEYACVWRQANGEGASREANDRRKMGVDILKNILYNVCCNKRRRLSL